MSQVIAIVDDDDAVREAMKSFVRSLGYNASTFGSAEEFLKSKQFSNILCIITDLQMPGLNGLDMQDLLIARGHRFPIIFITAYSDENVRARAMKSGAIGFLTKPVNLDHLPAMIVGRNGIRWTTQARDSQAGPANDDSSVGCRTSGAGKIEHTAN